VRVKKVKKVVLPAVGTSRLESTAGGPREQKMHREDHRVVHLAAAVVTAPGLLSRTKMPRMEVVER